MMWGFKPMTERHPHWPTMCEGCIHQNWQNAFVVALTAALPLPYFPAVVVARCRKNEAISTLLNR